MKKKAISILLALALVVALCVTVIAGENDLPDPVSGVITLTEDLSDVNDTIEDETIINLNGHKLSGTITNTNLVTIENKIETTVLDLDDEGKPKYAEGDINKENPLTKTEYIDTQACLLGVVGTFANDVSDYVADGYDTKNNGTTIFNNENPSIFKVVVEVKPEGSDYDSSNDFPDIYADEYVTVTVKVTGARYASADFTLTWDNSLFVDETASWDMMSGWVGHGADDYDGYTSYRFTSAHEKVDGKPQEEYFEDGEVIGKFTMRALYIDEAVVKSQSFNSIDDVIAANDRGSYNVFTVKSSTGPETAKVIGSWRKAKLDDSTTPLTATQLNDGVAHIILMDAMVGDVSAKTGLSYKAQEQNLLDTTYNGGNGFSALVGGQPPKGNDGNSSAEVATVVYTKAEYEALGSNAPAYGTAGTALTPAYIQGTNAGDYVVCYKISAPGYASVTGVKNVNIAKQKVDLVWTAPADFTSSTIVGVDYEGAYNSGGFSAPTATFTDLNNGTVDVSSTITTGPNGTTLKDVGVYEFEAVPNDNYEFNNPTVNVKVKGLTIQGWTLKATNYENTGNGTVVSNGVIWRDGVERPIGYLEVADDASFKLGEGSKYYTTDGTEVTHVNVTYEYSEGKYYKTEDDLAEAPEGAKVGDEIWTVITTTDGKTESELGKYKLRMTVTADNYEKMVQIVNFEIKNPIFVVENLEYVAGYSIVLVYTNETGVAFRYNNQMMYDVTDFGYRYNNNNYGNGSVPYAKVYAIVIPGEADVSLVYASNSAAKTLTLPAGYTNMMPSGNGYKGNIYVDDVNNKAVAKVDLDDITAVQSIYNVNAGNMQDMEVVLRADVNRDKKVDLYGDVPQVMAYYLSLTPETTAVEPEL